MQPASLESGTILEEEQAELLLSAGRIFLAERAAVDYLARSEHSRYLLTAKLVKKGFRVMEYQPAFDYLEQRGYLDDARFASAWLRSRAIHRTEGRLKLQAGLLSRGIASATAKAALDEYFGEHDEAELCAKMAEKLIRQGKSGEKLAISLVRRGFSVKLVRSFIEKIDKM